MKALLNWIDDRTGAGGAIRGLHEATVPGRACLCRSLPFLLVFMFLVQGITGLVLLMYYSPSAQTAWESVYYLQHDIQGGWLLRAVHHYAGQAILILVGIQLLGMILRGSYRPPREFVFWMVVFLGLVSLGLLLTGDLLAWDQNSQSATLVRVKFLTLLPVVGADLFKLASGGPSFGSLTLTRFLALHVVVLGGAFAVLLILRAWFAHRAAAAARAKADPDAPSTPLWPNQVLVNLVGCLVVLGIVLLVAVSHGTSGDHAGVALGAPADPSDFYAAARPEWAFSGLYGFSNLFPGDLKVLPIFVIPGALVLLFLLMPFVGRLKIGHAFNILLTLGLLVGDGVLTYAVYAHDRENVEFLSAVAEGRQASDRIVQLIQGNGGIPVTGALTLLQDDPKTQGPRLFRRHCASCHNYVGGTDGDIKAEKPSAPNLYGYGTKAWMAGWLDPERIAGPDYLGDTKFKHGDMVEFVEETYSDMEKEDKEDRDLLLDALAAEAKLKSRAAEDKKNAERIAEGKELIADCADCHKYDDEGQLGAAPDLTGYTSREWTLAFISNPAGARFYGKKNDRMLAYAESDDPSKNILSRRELEMLTDWLRGEWYEPEK